MERKQPIIADIEETVSGFRSRSVAGNMARIGISVSIGTILISGALVANYAGPQIMDAAMDAARSGSPGIQPEVIGGLLKHALDGVTNDVMEVLQATKDVFTVQTDHFRNGTLIEHNKDFIKDLPGGQQAYAAFEKAINAPVGGDGGTLAEKYGPDAVGIASICLIAGSVLYTGVKAVRKAMNIAASGFKYARDAVSRFVDKARGIQHPPEPKVFDPFVDPIPAVLTGDPDKERLVHSQFAKLMKEAGLEDHQALGVADFVVQAFIAGGHDQRDMRTQLDAFAQSRVMDREKISRLQEQVNELSDPDKQREKARKILAELSAEQLGATGPAPQPDNSPSLS
jgi:hypothetical protein